MAEPKSKTNRNAKNGAKYSDMEIAQTLALYDVEGSISKVSKSTGYTRYTISKWINEREKYEGGKSVLTAEDFGKVYSAKKYELLNECLELQSLALQQAKAKIGEASAYHATLIYGILHDKIAGKAEAQQGGNTTNIMISNMDNEQATDLMARVLERANTKKTDV